LHIRSRFAMSGEKSKAGGGAIPAWSGAQILQLDKRIRRVVLMSTTGERMWVESRGLAPVLLSAEEFQMSDLATLITAVLKALGTVTRYFGRGLYLVGAFEEYKVLILQPLTSEQILTIVLPRRVNADIVYRKVVGFIESHPAKTVA